MTTHKYDEPWFTNLAAEDRQHVIDQDFARRDAQRAVEQEASVDDHSPAKLAFVELCCQQFRENMRIADRRNRNAFRTEFDPDRETLRRAAAELGLVVTEQDAAA